VRVLLVCSPGGHLQQMLALRPAWEGDHSWASLHGPDTDTLLAGETVDFGHGPTNRSITNLFRNLRFAHSVLRRRRPEVILSTGAGLAVPFFLVGRCLRIRCVYVESLTRTESISVSGRLVYPLAHRFFAQWPAAADRLRRAEYAGRIL